MNKRKIKQLLISVLILLCCAIAPQLGEQIGIFIPQEITNEIPQELSFNLNEIPEYSGQPYVLINDNIPDFDDTDYAALITTNLKDDRVTFEKYSELDYLGRCGVAYACLGLETMPEDDEDRGYIGQVRPSGWQTARYDDVISGKYLYNRCHLIGYQLSGENANIQNLITGTRYLNVEGMLPFENQIADYLEETGNRVLYRVTPIFEGKNLVASGVQIEAESVEDSGEGICFNVYVYNVQPQIEIDYATGESKLKG